MIYYLFATDKQFYRDGVLVASSEITAELTAIGNKFNRCEWFLMDQTDTVIYSSWEKIEKTA